MAPDPSDAPRDLARRLLGAVAIAEAWLAGDRSTERRAWVDLPSLHGQVVRIDGARAVGAALVLDGEGPDGPIELHVVSPGGAAVHGRELRVEGRTVEVRSPGRTLEAGGPLRLVRVG